MLQRFIQNSAGGVAPMFAIGAIGAAIDYSRAGTSDWSDTRTCTCPPCWRA
jgi:hypothetical protein